MKYDINELLDMVVKQGASDLHIQVGQSPALRVDGSIYAVDGDPLTPEGTEELRKVGEAVSFHAHLISSKTDFMVPSYDKKTRL